MERGKQPLSSLPRNSVNNGPSKKKISQNLSTVNGRWTPERVAALPKTEINRRDIFGRTLAHLAAASGRIDAMTAVCDNIHVDLLAADYENGWTPLHTALVHGNVGCAQVLLSHCPEAIKTKDRDRSSPMEIINSMLGIKVDRASSSGGTQLFMFGSNANHTLGFADPDNRSNPEMVKLKRNVQHTVPRFKFHPLTVKHVALSKLHSAVITGDSSENLLVCGIPRGGRLGFNSTAFTFTRVPGFRNEKIVNVALGLDHSVAVTESGCCYTWGSNHYSQLGYNLGDGNSSNNVQSTPRKVGGDLKKLTILGCSASNIHTVAFTSVEMFCWGKNNGQLGFPTDNEFEPVPRKVLHLSHPVTMVKAADIATIVLLENTDVWVFMNGDRFRVQFPLERKTQSFDVFTPRIPVGHIVKISASLGGQVCALDSNGSVYGFNLAPYYNRNNPDMSARTIMRNLKVSKLWTARKSYLRAVDVDIGDEGSLILCTESGAVWRLTGKKKFRRVPLINRIRQVRCDSSFTSFAAIRDETKLEPVSVSSLTLGDDLHYLVPFVETSENRKADDLLRSCEANRTEMSFFGAEIPESATILTTHASDHCASLISWLASCSDDSVVKLGLPEIDRVPGSESLTFRVNDVTFDVLKYLVLCRSPVFEGILAGKPLIVATKKKIFCSGNNSLVFDGFQVTSVVILIYYLYTDILLSVWNSIPKNVPKHILIAKDELLELGRLLKLSDFCVAIQRHCQPHRNIADDLLKLKGDIDTSDVIIHLKDNQFFYCHSFVLRSRSAVFATLLSERWDYRDKLTKYIEVDLKNINMGAFEIVIYHLYGDRTNDIFDSVQSESSKDFITFVLEVLRAADYLLLPKLMEICQSVLLNFGWLLGEIADISAAQLESRLLCLLCYNAECVLENGFLDMSQDLFDRLDDAMRGFLDRPSPTDTAFFKFQDDYETYNEDLTSLAPVYGIKTQTAISTLRDWQMLNSTEVEESIVQTNVANSTTQDGVFDFELEEKSIKGKEKDTWMTVVGPSGKVRTEYGKPAPNSREPWVNRSDKEQTSPMGASKHQNSAVVNKGSTPSSPKPMVSATADDNSPSGSRSWKTPVRRFSSTSASPWQSAKKTLAEDTKKASSSPRPSSLSSMFASAPKSSPKASPKTDIRPAAYSTGSPITGPTTVTPPPSTFITPEITTLPTMKMSQKERRKLQRERRASIEGTTSSSSQAWAIPGASSSTKTVWKIASKSEATQEESPFAVYKASGGNKDQSHQEEVSLEPTLADIIQQEHHNVQQQAWQATRTLRDIQQEEEFQKWWAKESQRAQDLAADGSNKENSRGEEVNQKGRRPRNRPRKSKPGSRSTNRTEIT